MSDSFDSADQSDVKLQRRATSFQEAPGEAEAESMRASFLQRAGQTAVPTAMDPGLQREVIARMQQEQGNGFVQRLLAVSRHGGGEEEGVQRAELQRESTPTGTPGRLVGLPQSEMVSEVLQRKDGGSPLPAGTQQQMGGFFGSDFSGVRVHTGGTSETLNSELDARAFTVGSDVFFNKGEYAPDQQAGQGLLAHELTHVVQQGGASPVQRAAAPEEEEQVQKMSLQREGAPEEEEQVQKMSLQREGAPEEEEQVQKMSLQREGAPEEEEQVQKMSLQREGAPEEEEQVQKMSLQREGAPEEEEQVQKMSIQREAAPEAAEEQ